MHFFTTISFYFICILQSTVIRDNQAQSWYFVAPNPESKSWHQSQTPTSPKRRLQSKRILTFLFWSWALPPFYSPCFLNDEICLTKSSVRIITNWCAKRLLLFEAEFSSRPPRVVRVVVDLYSEAIFSVFVASAKQTIIEDVF